jgi:Iron-containing redox enzyme
VLAGSQVIQPGDPDRSRLLTDLIDYRGPMFRIFTAEEQGTIREWITSLGKAAATETTRTSETRSTDRNRELGHLLHPIPSMAREGGSGKQLNGSDNENMSLREAYYRLVNIELFPSMTEYAREYVGRWMEEGKCLLLGACDETSKLTLSPGETPEMFELMPYTREYLDERVEEQHRRQVASYLAFSGTPPFSKEQWCGMFATQGPALLIDGAWIQYAAIASLSHTEIHSRLFRVYSDEIGNGVIEWNHPNVMRRLLEQMGINLPHVSTREFIESPSFPDFTFVSPVFWLALSLFPRRYLPELLGVNLCIELDGVGGLYRMGADCARYFELDPTICTLHNSIDNNSTGHTAWSREAIHLYLDDMYTAGGEDLRQRMWTRVWTGFCAWAMRHEITGRAQSAGSVGTEFISSAARKSLWKKGSEGALRREGVSLSSGDSPAA